jgi:hypothetical protein
MPTLRGAGGEAASLDEASVRGPGRVEGGDRATTWSVLAFDIAGGVASSARPKAIPETLATERERISEKGSCAMKLSSWMAAKAIVVVIFGIGFVLVPVGLGSVFGLSLNPSGALMAQLFGAAFILESIVLWLPRKESLSHAAVRAIVTAVVISNAIGFVVTLLASLSGVWNALGWLPVLLYLVFGLAFAYFLFSRPPAR